VGKVCWHVTMSLDGFIAGPDDAVDWVFGYVPLDSPATRSMLEETIRTTGSVLSGRRSYNVGRKPGQRPEARKVMGGAWSGPVFVLTHKAPEDEEDMTIRFISGDIRSAIGVAHDAAGEKDVMAIGADIARQCIQEGLIDEIRVHLAPVLLGDGVRFFSWPGAREAVRLETIEAVPWGQMTYLHYRVIKRAVTSDK
jgi:dihydrofolate reductase